MIIFPFRAYWKTRQGVHLICQGPIYDACKGTWMLEWHRKEWDRSDLRDKYPYMMIDHISRVLKRDLQEGY